jgi:hypothetical protein
MRLLFAHACLAAGAAFLSGALLFGAFLSPAIGNAANYALGVVCGAIAWAALFYIYAVMFYPSQRLS